MKHRLSFRMIMIFVVLGIMFASVVLTYLFLLLLHAMGVLALIKGSPLILPFISLVVALVLGLIIAAVCSKVIITPLRWVIDGMRTVSTGDFSPRVPLPKRPGDMYDLIDGFNAMTEELGGIEMLRNDFINTFSHEFKTPIVSLRGFARQLKEPALSEETRAEYLNIILSESERLANMSSNILLLSRFESQEIVTGKAEFRMDEQIREAILLLEKKWERKNIEFSLALPAVTYYGNEEMTAHIWRNLLDNAIKFSNPGGVISVSLTTHQGKPRVQITDGGVGMSSETLRRIYDKFYQGDTSHATEGNGLGLPLVKQIVELCGGEIRAYSQVGKGTTFTVSL
ncbi:MAG: HAMP domain-containing histidine kinase [Clostridia bacterium]|nr:HAMP domain-containing histidine kinase [Clostridia bacterium]